LFIIIFFYLSERNGSIDLDIIFEKPIGILFPSQSSVKGQHMHLHFPPGADIELLVDKTLPDCNNIIEVKNFNFKYSDLC
jgi:hypothetical protein